MIYFALSRLSTLISMRFDYFFNQNIISCLDMDEIYAFAAFYTEGVLIIARYADELLLWNQCACYIENIDFDQSSF